MSDLETNATAPPEEIRTRKALEAIAGPRPVDRPFFLPKVRVIHTPKGDFNATTIYWAKHGLTLIGYTKKRHSWLITEPGDDVWRQINGDKVKRHIEAHLALRQ